MTLYLGAQIIGFAGAIFLLYAYARVSSGYYSIDDMPYHLFNLTGALLLVINTAYFDALGAMALNIVWFLIAIGHLFRIKKDKKH